MKKKLASLMVLNLLAVSVLGMSPVLATETDYLDETSNLIGNTGDSEFIEEINPLIEQEFEEQPKPNVFEETAEAMTSAAVANELARSSEPPVVGGVAYFSDYGIIDDSVPCDKAFEQMIANHKVNKIVGTSNLWFQKRHVITRNNLEIDFGNYEVKNGEMEDAAPNDPFAAVLIFKGDNQGEMQQVTLKEDMTLYQEVFEVADSSQFERYEYYRVHVNARPGKIGTVGKQEKEIDKLIMVTEIVDDTHVKFNYRMGWEIEAGRILTYDKVEPVRNVTVKNMRYFNTGVGELDSASPVSFEYVVEGNVSDIEAYHTYWPTIMRRHNTHYYTIRCKLYNPIEVVVGGTGYLTQQIHTLFGTVKDNQTSAARHLNDFTGSAYCVVENNHATNDYHGGFVTHGQFEHDLTYINNSGLLSFANSGLTWGESARRITVKKHYGSWVIARTKITDLTLEDVEVHAEDYYPDSGKFLINADGAQLKGCTGDGVIFTQRSNRSRRSTSIEGSSFKPEEIVVTKEGPNAVISDIIFKDFSEKPGESTEPSTSSSDSSSTTEPSTSSSDSSSTTEPSTSSSDNSSSTEPSTSSSDNSSSTEPSTSSSDNSSSTEPSTSSSDNSSSTEPSTSDSSSSSEEPRPSKKELIRATNLNPTYVGAKFISGKTLPKTSLSYQLEGSPTTDLQKTALAHNLSDDQGEFKLPINEDLKVGDIILVTLRNGEATMTIKQIVKEQVNTQEKQEVGANTKKPILINDDNNLPKIITTSNRNLPSTGEQNSQLALLGLIFIGSYFFLYVAYNGKKKQS